MHMKRSTLTLIPTLAKIRDNHAMVTERRWSPFSNGKSFPAARTSLPLCVFAIVEPNAINHVDEDWQQRVESHFAQCRRTDPPADDAIIGGHVVANAPTGIYLDVGCGIPAFLEIIYVPDDGDDGVPRWTKPHDSKLTVMVSHSTNDTISVHQMDYEKWAPEFDAQKKDT